MYKQYVRIRDHCRKGLLKYLEKALLRLPPIQKPSILDVGCGSGVPTLFLADRYDGKITAIDPDAKLLDSLEEKIMKLNLTKRFTLLNCSFFDAEFENEPFDIILAEGFLNTVDFQKGFLKLLTILRNKGFLIVHDELRDNIMKRKFIADNGCTIIDSFILDDQVWWNDYYKCLEKEIVDIKDKALLSLFSTTIHEIEQFKKDSSEFQSQYFVIEKH
jgi:ubiquinone/menaquinone biosynthesis C-methylase UbiE